MTQIPTQQQRPEPPSTPTARRLRRTDAAVPVSNMTYVAPHRLDQVCEIAGVGLWTERGAFDCPLEVSQIPDEHSHLIASHSIALACLALTDDPARPAQLFAVVAALGEVVGSAVVLRALAHGVVELVDGARVVYLPGIAAGGAR